MKDLKLQIVKDYKKLKHDYILLSQYTSKLEKELRKYKRTLLKTIK